MIPSKRWFPTTLIDRSAWVSNFAKNFANVALDLGFTAADIDSMNKDAEDLQALARSITAAEAFMSGLRGFRSLLTEASLGSPQPVFPTLILTPPPNGVPAGIFKRLDDKVRRVRASAAYTPSIGALLAIIPATPEGLAETELAPSLKVNAMPRNIIQVRFTRGDTDGLSVEIKLDKEKDWINMGRFLRSPAVIEVPDGTGLPHAVEIRARYLIGNDPVGQNSNVVNVVTTP